MTEPAKSYHHGNLAAAILGRAAEIIDTQGIEALTLRGIARDLGVSHGAPNRHFRNKAELLSALATDGWTRALEATLGAAEATGSNNAHVRLHAMGCGFLRLSLIHICRAYRTMLKKDGLWRQPASRLRVWRRVASFFGKAGSAMLAALKPGYHPTQRPDPAWVDEWRAAYADHEPGFVPILDTTDEQLRPAFQ